ncbi:MAG: hypothetical protein E6230_19515 [Paenibacillus dendritiformis]|uniref:hypothetical protein n=1 Tax=uncultured Paenibacillus sp. TaxID=227322 RepID=UPI0025EF6CE6|nr:hypothetical protein [uncultured Paenibacillus sp.]MDU5144362.1 hypothetical protein [Paenibacillus dendritiformis]
MMMDVDKLAEVFANDSYIVRISLYHSWSSQNKREWHGLRIAGRIRVARGSRHANGIASCRSIRVGVLSFFIAWTRGKKKIAIMNARLIKETKE